MRASELAAAHGLTLSGARPPLPGYVRQLWARRAFIHELARARHEAQYRQARLGRFWMVVTPLLNAAVYYLIFGLLMSARHGVPHYIPFLVTGVFVFAFTQSSAMAGVKALSGNLGLVRTLDFPRASLPIALTLTQLRQLTWSLVVLAAVLVAGGELPGARWLLVFPALALQLLFNTGVALVLARLGSRSPDLGKLLPFVLRTWLYGSGVMYSVADKAATAPPLVRAVLDFNPAALYIDLVRAALIDGFRLTPDAWPAAAAWAVAVAVAGFVCFWQGEESYGRG